MKVQPTFYSFAAGELDERLLARTDIDAASHGAKQMVNLIGKSAGPAMSRGGTRVIFASPTYDNNKETRLFSGPWGVYGNYAYFFGNVLGMVSDPYLSDTSLSLVTPSGLAGLKLNDSHAYDVLKGTGIRIESVYSRIANYVVSSDPISSYTGSDTYHIAIQFASRVPKGLMVQILERASDSSVLATHTIYPINCEYVLFSFVQDPALYNIDVFFELTTEDYSVVRVDSINLYDVIPGSYYDIGQHISSSFLTTNYYRDVRCAYHPITNDIILTHPSMAPRRLYYNSGGIATAAISFTSTPSEWTGSNYPSVCTFFQGRSWWAGCPNNPSKLWASKSSDYYNMTVGSLADDAIAWVRAKSCRIINMFGGKQLLIGTDKDEFLISSEGSVVTGSDIDYKVQSAHGSSFVNPIDLGDKILYVGPDRQRIWEASYKWTDDLWKSRHINFTAMHLFRNKEIKEIHFHKNQESLVFVIFIDGTAVIGTYDEPNNIVNWSPFITDAFISSACVIERIGRSYLLIAMLRDYDNPTATVMLSIESYSPNLLLDHAMQKYDENGYAEFDVENDLFGYYIASVRRTYSNYGDNRIATGNWSINTGVFDSTNYVWEMEYSAGQSLLDLDVSGSWATGIQPAYIRVQLLNHDPVANSNTAILNVYAGTNLLATIEANEMGLMQGSLNWVGVSSDLSNLTVSLAHDSAPTDTPYIVQIVFADSLDDLITLNNAFQQEIIDHTTGERTLYYNSVQPELTSPNGDTMLSAKPDTVHSVIGVAYPKKLVTLQPKIDSVTGSGRAALRGSCKAQIGLINSAPPTVNNKPVTVDDDTEVDSKGNIVLGKVHVSLTGATNTMRVTIEQKDAKELNVSEVQLEIDQNTL